MLFDNSEVISELIKIAKKGEAFKDVFCPKNPYQEDIKVIEDKNTATGPDIIEVAHPEPVITADALGDGGLVENQNEQHERMMAVINKMPTGLLVHRYACCFAELIKEAELCEAGGDIKTANELTETARKVLEQSPFA